MEITNWALDPTHSEIQFKVKHLLISNVTGSFRQFTAGIETEGDDFEKAKVHFEADLSSISTNNEQRDAHLKNTDFFDAETYPKLTFESDKLEKLDEENYKAYGKLTIRGNTKDITLNVTMGGITADPWGNTRAGFSIDGKINRKDFGVSFNKLSETGGLMLGEEVAISAEVQFVKQAVLQAA